MLVLATRCSMVTGCGPTHPLTELMVLPADHPPPQDSSDPVTAGCGESWGGGFTPRVVESLRTSPHTYTN